MSDEYTRARNRLVDSQVLSAGVTDEAVIRAMRTVPRHLFVPKNQQYRAYVDTALPIGFGQTISQPSLVALMSQLLRLTGIETVLEIGTGSGYQAAILSLLTKRVYSIERIRRLADRANKTLKRLGYSKVTVIKGDGSQGYKEAAPYDAIISTAAVTTIPPALENQLAEKGRIILPVENLHTDYQNLQLGVKQAGVINYKPMHSVLFVPLIQESDGC